MGRKKTKQPIEVIPEERQTGQDSPYAYSITDVNFGEFKVLNSANAWWLDKIKVENLITHFKIDGSVEEACSLAGITRAQYDYFVELHKDFSEKILPSCKELPNIKARQVINNKMSESYQNAMDYLKRKKKSEFGDSIDVNANVKVEKLEEIQKATKNILNG